MLHRPAFALAASILAVAASGCGHAPFRCETRGGPPWREVVSPGFSLKTDLPPPKARALAQEIERLDDAVRGGLVRFVLPPGTAFGEAPPRLEVVAFASEGQFRTFAPPEVRAFFSLREDGHERVVTYGGLGGTAGAVVAHELTHRWLSRAIPALPLWPSEGLAVYMESLGGMEGWLKRGQATFGGIPPYVYLPPPTQGQVYLVLQRTGGLPANEYAIAWALVHFLQNAHRPRFEDYLGRLVRGEAPEPAWHAAFPGWNPRVPEELAALHGAFRRYLDGGDYTYRAVTLARPPEVEERPLRAAEVHALRFELPRAVGRRAPRLVRALEREVEEVLAEAPGHLEALRAAAALQPERAADLARQAVAAHADAPDAWVFLAASLGDADAAGRDEALARALALEPDHAVALRLRAIDLTRRRQTDEAIRHAERAVRAAPRAVGPLLTLGDAFVAAGRCVDGLGAYWRALDLATIRGWNEAAAEVRTRILPVQRSCPQAFNAPAAPR